MRYAWTVNLRVEREGKPDIAHSETVQAEISEPGDVFDHMDEDAFPIADDLDMDDVTSVHFSVTRGAPAPRRRPAKKRRG